MRILVIVNTRSGGGDAGLYDYVRALGAGGAEVRALRSSTDARRSRTCSRDAGAFDRVVAAGGDGTVSAVCYALRDTGVPVLVYPAGTANLLALNLGVPPRAARPRRDHRVTACRSRSTWARSNRTDDADGAISPYRLRRHGRRRLRRVDHGGRAADEVDPRRGRLPARRARQPRPTISRFEIDLDGEPVETDGIAVLVVNFGRLQFDIAVARGADPRDGVLDIAVLRSKNIAELLPTVAASIFDRAGRRDAIPGIDVYSASVRDASEPSPRCGCSTTAKSSRRTRRSRRACCRGAATLLAAADSPYARQS